MSLSSNFGTITIVPAVPQILDEFHIDEDNLYSTLLTSVWELGECIGPFLVGPLSELYGRMPVYHTGNVLFIICSIACALSTSISMLVAFRFLNGLVVTFLTLASSVVGDLFEKENRGSALAIAIALPLTGPFIAPVIGGCTAEAKGWRWTIWIVVIAVGSFACLSLVFFRETYQVKILNRKADRLRRETGNDGLRSKHQDTVNRYSFPQSIKRPIQMLFLSPVVIIIALYTAITYGLSYLILTTLTEVMQNTYGFGQGAVGLTFLGRGILPPSLLKVPLTLRSYWQCYRSPSVFSDV